MAGNYMVQVYAPSIFILMVSWFCFWMGHRAANITDRITLLVTTLLTLVTQFSGFRQDIPPISYICGIDVWMSGCLIFMFLSLLETIMVSRAQSLDVIETKQWIPTTQMEKRRRTLPSKLATHKEEERLDDTSRLDHASRFIFPSSFCIYSIVYFAVLFSEKLQNYNNAGNQLLEQ